MAQRKASEAQFWFEVGGEPADTFQLAEFYGSETIHQPFRFELQLVAPVDADLNLPDFLNKPATLTIQRGQERKELHGILCDLEETGRSKDSAQYHGVLVPRLWKLSLFYQSRVFQNQSVPDIIKAVLKDAGLSGDDYRIQVKHTHASREYCAQYRETDLNFISRLMEYEGIYYFFDHAGGKDVVVMVDDKSNNPKIQAPSEIESFVGEGVDTDEETVRELAWHEKMVTGKVMLKDYNYRTPETNLTAESQIDGNSPGKYYEYGEHFKTVSEGEALAKVRNEEIEAGRRLIVGMSDCRGFHPGYKFTLSRHYRDALNGDYLLTQVLHTGAQGGGIGAAAGASGTGPAYRNQFTCIPADVQFRPPRITPEPRIPGIMTAKVESAGGEYAHIDDMGRYYVKMPFDLGEKGKASASKPIRVAQPYTGTGYGMHFPVHAGGEMVWACVDGNVDRPLGLSTVPNPSKASPVTSANKTINMLKTHAGNSLSMDDTKGSEKLDISTPYDNSITAGHDQTITVKNNRTISVDGTFTETIKKDTKITITEGNLEYAVAAGTAQYKVKGAVTELFDDTQSTTVKGAITVKSTGGAIIVSSDSADVSVHAATKIKLETGSSSIEMKSDGSISIKGVNITIDGSASVTIKGNMIHSEAQAQHETKGAIVLSDGSATNTVKGGMVMLNP